MTGVDYPTVTAGGETYTLGFSLLAEYLPYFKHMAIAD
jgi:hypothetical protein